LKGWLSVWALKLDGNMLAFEFHLQAEGKEYALCGHYLPEYSSLSPGTYLELHILKHVFSETERLQKYEMGNFYNYKSKWSDKSEAYVKLSVFGRRAYSRLLSFHEMTAVPVLRRIVPQQVWQHRIFRLLGIKTAPYDIRQH
jgi:CelD/BcsL family acetyltransferase involved in cellulose biosynthesis